ncbi:MAG: nucleotidyltransferase family protein [Thermodesulfovibrionales bacterium]|nr:nucleotidyltransferase family protein [Thermodesulfovibrionales bacterium]
MTQADVIDFLKSHKSEFKERLGVISIGLFGSYARGDARDDSDIDIAVELYDDQRADNFFRLLHFLEDNLHKKIDLGVESTLKPSVTERVKQEIIYV